MNNITLIGRLTKDAELKYTQDQTPVISFILAVSRGYKDKNGNKITDFIPCVALKKEKIAQYLKKGTQIAVEGSLNIDSWQKNGVWQSFTKVNVHNIELLEYNKPLEENKSTTSTPEQQFQMMNDKDIPF